MLFVPFSSFVHEYIWQKLQEKNLDTWKNIRGPRPWEDSKEYQEQQRARLNKGVWLRTFTHSCLFQLWDVKTGSPGSQCSYSHHIWARKVVCMWFCNISLVPLLSLDHLYEHIGKWFRTFFNNWWCLYLRKWLFLLWEFVWQCRCLLALTTSVPVIRQ